MTSQTKQTMPTVASIGVDIGKDVFHLVSIDALEPRRTARPAHCRGQVERGYDGNTLRKARASTTAGRRSS